MIRFSLFLTACFSVLSVSANAQSTRQIIQVATYQMESDQQAEKFDAMMPAAIKALNGVGVNMIGVFKLAEPESDKAFPNLRVVITPYKNLEQRLASQNDAFKDNGEFWDAAKDYLSAEPDAKPFARVDSVMLHAFEGMPEMKVPGTGEGKKRLFELRTYESYSELTGIIKVQMFNDGEIELFEEVGLPAVFYGSAIAGGNLPQLTYMLVHDDAQAQKIGWQRFIKSPQWASLQQKEPYAGRKLVSKIKKTMLIATEYSQVK